MTICFHTLGCKDQPVRDRSDGRTNAEGWIYPGQSGWRMRRNRHQFLHGDRGKRHEGEKASAPVQAGTSGSGHRGDRLLSPGGGRGGGRAAGGGHCDGHPQPCLPAVLCGGVFEHRQRIVAIRAHEEGENFEAMQVGGFEERTRAFVKIQDGCNRYCSYCIIPTARGPIRSKSLSSITEELAALAKAGYREAVLVGINLSAYGEESSLTLPRTPSRRRYRWKESSASGWGLGAGQV